MTGTDSDLPTVRNGTDLFPGQVWSRTHSLAHIGTLCAQAHTHARTQGPYPARAVSAQAGSPTLALPPPRSQPSPETLLSCPLVLNTPWSRTLHVHEYK